MANFKLVEAADSVYAINQYLAISGLQRFNYTYTGREQDIDEIGTRTHVETVTEPETSGSFEVTDTGALASLFARMRYDYDNQEYMAGAASDLSTSEFTITEEDLQYMIFDLVEQKKPGGTFSEAKLIPNCFLTRFGVRLTADNVGTVSFDWMGNLLKPVYKPYHQVQSYPVVYTTASTATLDAGLAVDATTHGILGAMVNNIELGPTDVTFATTVVTITASGLAKIGGAIDVNDRIMVFLYNLTPSNTVAIDYVNSVNFVRPDRIDLWLVPEATAVTDANRMLRVQSFDFSADIPRDELKEIKRNESRTSTFFRHARYPLNFTGSFNVLEETMHKWAELQGKTLNEAALAATVDDNNVLDVNSWVDAKVVAKWYKYGSTDPIQDLTLARVKITGLSGTQTVGGRKELVWNFKSDGDLEINGYDVA